MNITKEQFWNYLVDNNIVIVNTIRKVNQLSQLIGSLFITRYDWTHKFYFPILDDKLIWIDSGNAISDVGKNKIFLTEKELLKRLEIHFLLKKELQNKPLKLYL